MITTQDIEKLASLARVKIDDTEKQSLTKEIDSILAYVDQIKKATIDMDYTPAPGAAHNVTRPDEPRTLSGEDRERILNEAPDREGDFVAVKKIIAQD
jgi:aspartyl-tRNA(Asn)/glutamyl-tRNA(Gln) amidotransferase subunit C